MELIQHWVAQYGYVGLFSLLVLGIVGLPIPDETLLALAGYMVYRGQLRALPTGLSALLGSMCGITLSYLIGRTTGYYLIHRFGRRLGIKDEKVEMVHGWFRRWGGLTLTFGYYVPGVRHLTACVAGASKLEYPAFAAFAYSGAVLWVTTFLTLGYFLGERWSEVPGQMHKVALIGGCVLVALGILYLLRKRLGVPSGGTKRSSR
jgi:membrane protein DedA with SNARE-associated domain